MVRRLLCIRVLGCGIFLRAAPNCGRERVFWLWVSIGYSTTGKVGGYVKNAAAVRWPEKLTCPRNGIAVGGRIVNGEGYMSGTVFCRGLRCDGK